MLQTDGLLNIMMKINRFRTLAINRLRWLFALIWWEILIGWNIQKIMNLGRGKATMEKNSGKCDLIIKILPIVWCGSLLTTEIYEFKRRPSKWRWIQKRRIKIFSFKGSHKVYLRDYCNHVTIFCFLPKFPFIQQKNTFT